MPITYFYFPKILLCKGLLSRDFEYVVLCAPKSAANLETLENIFLGRVVWGVSEKLRVRDPQTSPIEVHTGRYSQDYRDHPGWSKLADYLHPSDCLPYDRL